MQLAGDANVRSRVVSGLAVGVAVTSSISALPRSVRQDVRPPRLLTEVAGTQSRRRGSERSGALYQPGHGCDLKTEDS